MYIYLDIVEIMDHKSYLYAILDIHCISLVNVQ